MGGKAPTGHWHSQLLEEDFLAERPVYPSGQATNFLIVAAEEAILEIASAFFDHSAGLLHGLDHLHEKAASLEPNAKVSEELCAPLQQTFNDPLLRCYVMATANTSKPASTLNL